MGNIKVKYVSLSEIKPAAYNPRKITDEELGGLKESLKKFGFVDPLIVNKRTGNLVGGHQRCKAAEQLGMTEVPVIEVDLGPTEEKALNVALNAHTIAGKYDLEVLPTLLEEIKLELPDYITDLRLDVLEEDLQLNFEPEKIEPVEGEDDVPEVPKEPITKLGDVWLVGKHRVMCGDSTMIDHVEKLTEKKSLKLCFTSPPYADQREYNGGKELSVEKLSKFISSAFGLVEYFAVNLGYSRKNGAVNRYWDEYIKEAELCGLKLLSWNIWDRSGYGASIGNQTAMFPIWHEWIFVFGEHPGELNRTKENKSAGSKSGTNRQRDGTTTKGSGVTAELGKIGTVVTTCMADGKLHPAMFPVELPEKYIEAMTKEGECIYEPFGGSGTVIIASEKTNRTCCCMELDPHYCDVIVERYMKFTGRDDVTLESTGEKYTDIKAAYGQTKD